MIGNVVKAATELFEEKVRVAGKKINSRPMGGGEKAGKHQRDTMESILVAPTGWRKSQKQLHGSYQYEVNFSAFCGSKNKVGDYTRTMVAALMAGQVTKLLEDQNWGLRDSGVGKAQFDRATDRTTREVADRGLAIYEVSWWQEMPLTIEDLDALQVYLLQIVRLETDLHGSLDDTNEMVSEQGNLQDPP